MRLGNFSQEKPIPHGIFRQNLLGPTDKKKPSLAEDNPPASKREGVDFTPEKIKTNISVRPEGYYNKIKAQAEDNPSNPESLFANEMVHYIARILNIDTGRVKYFFINEQDKAGSADAFMEIKIGALKPIRITLEIAGRRGVAPNNKNVIIRFPKDELCPEQDAANPEYTAKIHETGLHAILKLVNEVDCQDGKLAKDILNKVEPEIFRNVEETISAVRKNRKYDEFFYYLKDLKKEVREVDPKIAAKIFKTIEAQYGPIPKEAEPEPATVSSADVN